ncbi:SDR family oxidoreductase [Hoyosella sp. YIM 151337]|uniref:SDR family oxidoreductase n=1 Tax=Hoyosella sp. YIM 151337 TaxID=2992742 RepID=UPI0022367AA1|nr:SDR family oxidoreductase [Hoyosella sp. YIM 151337]MCW4355467.1 SDR family oxidoreductase [Hoyosella sp. YIM 151337]
MSIVVTGATGKLGTLVIAELLEKVPSSAITAVARSAEKAAALTGRGIEVRTADYGVPETLEAVFNAGDTVLLISGSEVGQRVPQHRAVIEAAVKADVSRLVYTSVLGGPAADFLLAEEHKETEQILIESGVQYTLLRNGWYSENYTEQIPAQLQFGVAGSAGAGRLGTASRADYAAAAAVVLTTEGHENVAYELSGDTSFTLTDYAAELARQTGTDVTYTDLPPAAFEEVLANAGVPAPLAHILADVDIAVSKGLLEGGSGDLSRLIGRHTTPISESIALELSR